MIVILFWYEFFSAPKLIEYTSNPIIYFTNALREVLKFYVNSIVTRLILVIPLFLSLIISVIEIPYRIKLEIEKEKASR
ncbi:hypothetical protein [Flavobacterium sp.]|uniref:hypothetical protein n=1 Tax=Flavobacterium sp. TaxID=239 RepID=UPI003263C196